MAEPDDLERLRRLDARIADLKKAHAPAPTKADHHTMAQVAWRMVIELVAGLGIGFGIGYGLDVLFGTRPVLLVLFTLLGFAAGVRTMLRTAEEVQEKERDKTAGPPAGKQGDNDRG